MHEEAINSQLDTIIDCLYRISVKAVIVQDGKILMVQENEKWWSLPGGGIDHGETITQALRRELAEELSIPEQEVTVDEQVLQAVIGQVVDHIPRIALLYKAKIPADTIKKTDHVLDYGWYTAQELGTIYVSPTIGGLEELLRRMS